jgi:hypothetical protein
MMRHGPAETSFPGFCRENPGATVAAGSPDVVL